jgi:hypothetical protein
MHFSSLTIVMRWAAMPWVGAVFRPGGQSEWHPHITI